MDFARLLDAYQQQVNAALTRFIEPLPFQSSPLVNAMHYGALLGGKRLRPFWSTLPAKCSTPTR